VLLSDLSITLLSGFSLHSNEKYEEGEPVALLHVILWHGNIKSERSDVTHVQTMK